MLCTFLYTSELISANPMPLVGRPKLAKTLPKALQTNSVAALLATLNEDPQSPRRRSTEQTLQASNRRSRNVKAATPDRWIRIAILLAAGC